MPARPLWLHRLPSILATLRQTKGVTYLDRQAFEELFQVKDRRARALMSKFQGVRLGNVWAVDRQALIKALEKVQAGEDFWFEHNRRQRVAKVLEQAKGEHPARIAAIPIEPIKDQRPTLASLPDGLTFRPGEFRVEFTNFEDFSQKMALFLVVLQNQTEEIRDLADSTSRWDQKGTTGGWHSMTR